MSLSLPTASGPGRPSSSSARDPGCQVVTSKQAGVLDRLTAAEAHRRAKKESRHKESAELGSTEGESVQVRHLSLTWPPAKGSFRLNFGLLGRYMGMIIE
jgi:hypothetical protein